MVDFLTLEDLKPWRRKACLMAFLGGIGFVIVTFIAMIFYPGGYTFLVDYFSSLGLFEVGGIPNPISRALFIIACIWAGCALIFFWVLMPTLFKQTIFTKIVSSIGSIFGIISSPFLILLAIYGGDLFGFEHFITTMLFFLCFALAILVFTVGIILNKDYPRRNISGIVSGIFSIILVLYVLSFFGVRWYPAILGSLVQKLMVYGLILWTVFQEIIIWNEIGD